MYRIVAAVIAGALACPVLAEGDAGKGEKGFKKCKSCHTIVSDAGETIVKGGKTGPNLYGLPGRVVGSTDFKYDADMKALGESGMVWDAEQFAVYVQDPTAWLREVSGNKKAKSKMSFKLKKGGEDIYAYLESVVK
ncbi:MAG: c-type cytochrome [Marinibacterium sp.]